MEMNGRGMIEILRESPICLAPMAEVNDLPFRMLCRRYGIKLCWTGMINAYQWNISLDYRRRTLVTCEDDSPLVCQLSGGLFDQLIRAAADISAHCDMVDINFGCSQSIAKRSGYGYYSVNTPEKRKQAIEAVAQISAQISRPVSIKMRIFSDECGNPDRDTTISFAKEMESAGVSLITIHGRYTLRNKKSEVLTEIMKSVVDSVRIPVIVNGGVTSYNEAQTIISQTGAAGVAIGQALNQNPSAMDPSGPKPIKDIALEYLELASEYPEVLFRHKKHIYTFLTPKIKEDKTIAVAIQEAKTIEELKQVVSKHF